MICGALKDWEMKKFFLAIDRRNIYEKESSISLKNTRVFIKSMDFTKGKLILVYNPLRKREMQGDYSPRDLMEYLETISRLKIWDE